ncbi:hypothetical protein NC651_014084 [Populus alba x Populus x berolinensis]|nr:hypothetical protein NC651_014084 [Populus alba x Populus x berolinensis]
MSICQLLLLVVTVQQRAVYTLIWNPALLHSPEGINSLPLGVIIWPC